MVFSDPAPAIVIYPAPDALALPSAISTLQPFLDIYVGKVIDYTSLAQVQAILSDPTTIPAAKSQIAPVNPAQSATEAFCQFIEAQDPVSADPRADASQISPASILELVTKLSALLAPGYLSDLVPFTTAACTNGKRLIFMALRRCLGYNQCGPFGPPIRTGAIGTVTILATESLADAFVKMWQSTCPAAFAAAPQQANQPAIQQQQNPQQQATPTLADLEDLLTPRDQTHIRRQQNSYASTDISAPGFISATISSLESCKDLTRVAGSLSDVKSLMYEIAAALESYRAGSTRNAKDAKAIAIDAQVALVKSDFHRLLAQNAEVTWFDFAVLLKLHVKMLTPALEAFETFCKERVEALKRQRELAKVLNPGKAQMDNLLLYQGMLAGANSKAGNYQQFQHRSADGQRRPLSFNKPLPPPAFPPPAHAAPQSPRNSFNYRGPAQRHQQPQARPTPYGPPPATAQAQLAEIIMSRGRQQGQQIPQRTAIGIAARACGGKCFSCFGQLGSGRYQKCQAAACRRPNFVHPDAMAAVQLFQF